MPPSDATTSDAPTRKRKRRLVLSPVRRPYPHAVAAARALCAPLGMREPRDIDVEAIAHRAGAELVLAQPRTQGEGHTLRVKGSARGLLAIGDWIWSTRHGRFVLAHEIGHLLLHAEHDVLPACLDATAKLAAGARKIEGEATDAGCEILMPEAWFAPDCRGEAPGMEQLRAMAERFHVDLATAALRALLYVEKPCAVVVARAGIVDWVACSEGWDLYLRRKRALPEGSEAARVAKMGEMGTGGGVGGVECAAEVWGGRSRGEGEEREETEERAPVGGEVREYVDRDRESGLVVAWLVRVQ